MEVILCHSCAVEHATDNVGVQCSKHGFVPLQTECSKYSPTREKRLEDALRELCDVTLHPSAFTGTCPETLRIALKNALMLLGK
jgi:hypothetical protein